MNGQKRVFIACPIGADDSAERRRSDRLLKHIIAPTADSIVAEGVYVELIRGDRTSMPGRISKQMIQDIVSCDVMIADLTGDNPNVLYEVGLRQALLKPYILMAERGHKLPFDLADIRTVFYNFDLDAVEPTRDELRNFLQRALNGEVSPIDQDLLGPASKKESEQTGTPAEIQVLEASSRILKEVVEMREKLDNLDRLSQRVEDIKIELDKVDYAARYGRAPAHLVNLMRLKNKFHGQAGGEAIGEVLTRVCARAAEDLCNLTSGSQEVVRFEEYHLVDKFLLKLMEVLPDGSVWLGVTRLQSLGAWTEESAEKSYFKFHELVQARTESEQIEYYRLWCFDDEPTQGRMLPVLQRQTAAKIVTRSCVARDVPDMSLIWVPTPKGDGVARSNDLNQLFSKLRANHYDPLCGIVFDHRGGMELDAMTLYSPKADRFDNLRYQFEQHWNRASSLS